MSTDFAALVSGAMLAVLPRIQPILRIAGALYIGWLAVRLFLSAPGIDSRHLDTSDVDAPTVRSVGFRDGLLLQPMNPKVVIYGLTLYSSFLGGMNRSAVSVMLSALVFAGASWISTNAWAITGSLVTRLFANPRAVRIVYITLGVLLVYSAIELSGLLKLIWQPGLVSRAR